MRQNALVMCFAERFATGRCRILYRLEVWFGRIFPAILEFLCHTTATLGEARIAYLVVIHKRLTTSGAQCLYHIWFRGICNALIALAMVVGTNIKNGVVFAVVPANQLVIFLHKREESTFLLIAVGTFFHLGKQPRARDNGMCLEQLDACRRTHLTRYDTGKIALNWQFINCAYLVCLNHKFQRAEKRLRLLALPMEFLTNGDITNRERGSLFHRFEHQFTVLGSVPQYSSFAEFHLLPTLKSLSLGRIGFV